MRDLRAVHDAVRFLAAQPGVGGVIDPFCGVGTSLAAANAYGLAAIGVDNSPPRCRKARAAAHTTNGFVDPKGLHFTRGEDLLDVYKVPDAKFFAQAFCRTCGSGMPNRDLTRDRVGIPFGALDTDPGQGAGDHIYCGSKAPWHTIADDIPQHDERP